MQTALEKIAIFGPSMTATGSLVPWIAFRNDEGQRSAGGRIAYEILRESVVTDLHLPTEVIQQSMKHASRGAMHGVKNIDIKVFDTRLTNSF